jgi:hypothetical protein
MDPPKLMVPGCNPAQIHNSLAQVVMLYGSLLDQQQRTIDLLQQQLNAALLELRKAPPQAPVAISQPEPELVDLRERLKLTIADRHKHYDRARELEKALMTIAASGDETASTLAKQALGWPVAISQPGEKIP